MGAFFLQWDKIRGMRHGDALLQSRLKIRDMREIHMHTHMNIANTGKINFGFGKLPDFIYKCRGITKASSMYPLLEHISSWDDI